MMRSTSADSPLHPAPSEAPMCHLAHPSPRADIFVLPVHAGFSTRSSHSRAQVKSKLRAAALRDKPASKRHPVHTRVVESGGLYVLPETHGKATEDGMVVAAAEAKAGEVQADGCLKRRSVARLSMEGEPRKGTRHFSAVVYSMPHVHHVCSSCLSSHRHRRRLSPSALHRRPSGYPRRSFLERPCTLSRGSNSTTIIPLQLYLRINPVNSGSESRRPPRTEQHLCTRSPPPFSTCAPALLPHPACSGLAFVFPAGLRPSARSQRWRENALLEEGLQASRGRVYRG
ncbi:hypothetical protein C8R45DRAFT_321847 [Mycena sanguinolenta]|nr:hypothetical protein C8R45DRAFT_321847 [Mycena sanguinolenta]